METATTGKILVKATIENQHDLWEVEKGFRKPEDVRKLEVDDALVDTGARMLSLPRKHIEALGLKFMETRPGMTAAGKQPVDIFGLVQLTIMDRRCPVDVAAVADDCPVLIGQLPLERLDFVVDPGRQKLIGDPAHGGEMVIELY